MALLIGGLGCLTIQGNHIIPLLCDLIQLLGDWNMDSEFPLSMYSSKGGRSRIHLHIVSVDSHIQVTALWQALFIGLVGHGEREPLEVHSPDFHDRSIIRVRGCMIQEVGLYLVV